MKKRNKKDDRPIEDLLRRAQQDDLTDDFEREAAEGFGMLGDTGEALEAKEAVDRRMDDLIGDHKKPLLIYWSMAAGLILVIGLTVFLMRDSGALGTNDHLGHAETEAVVRPLPSSAPAQEQTTIQQEKTAGKRSEPVQRDARKEKKPGMTVAAAEPEEKNDESSAAAAGEPVPNEITASDLAQATPPPPVPVPEPSVPSASYEKALRPQPVQTGRAKKTKGDGSPPEASSAAYRSSDDRSADMQFEAAGNSVGPALKECVEEVLKRKIPANLSKKFEATLLVNDGEVKSVKFARGSKLTDIQKSRIDSLIKSDSGPCLTGVSKNHEAEVGILWEP